MSVFKHKSSVILAFLLALALAVPSLGQAMPLGGPVQQLLMLVVLAITLVHGRFTFRINGKLRSHSLICASLLAVNMMLLMIAVMQAGMWEDIVKQDFVLGIFSLILLFGLSGVLEHANSLIRQYILYLMMIACLVSILGLYKFSQLLEGIKFDWIANAAGDIYPWGTSLVADYNYYASTVLVGMIASMWLANNGSQTWRKVLAWGSILLCIVAGFFAGSRRFWVIAPLSLIIAAFIAAPKQEVRSEKSLTRWFVLIVMASLIISSLSLVLDEQSEFFNADILYRIGTISEGSAMDERTSRWLFALDYLDGSILLHGDGFNYLYVYSQKFTHGKVLDYPHNPILSAAMYGGAIGFICAVLFYIFAVCVAIKLIWQGLPEYRLLGLMSFAQLFFVMISANTLFSIASFSCTVVICSFAADLPKNVTGLVQPRSA